MYPLTSWSRRTLVAAAVPVLLALTVGPAAPLAAAASSKGEPSGKAAASPTRLEERRSTLERGAARRTPVYVRDHVLVRFDPAVSSARAEDTLGGLGLQRGRAIPKTGFYRVPTKGRDPSALRAVLAAQPGVAQAELDIVRSALRTPRDPLYASGAQSYLDLVRTPEAWDVTVSSPDVVVAIVDTGVNPAHEDLTGRVLPGYNAITGGTVSADDQGHGTAVAGVAAASSDNSKGMTGVAWSARILPVKVLNAAGDGSDADVAEGIIWAADHGADVINLSLGSPGTTTVLANAVAYAVGYGVTLVAASGNSGDDVLTYPASFPEVISVGATDAAGRLAFFSTWNERVDLTAPGWDVLGPNFAQPTGYVTLDGTSLAAPVVSGVAALLSSRFPTLMPEEIEDRLRSSARDAGPRGIDPYYGAGSVDAAAALGFSRAAPVPPIPGDGDDVPARARALASTATGKIAPEGDVDWYSVTLAAAGRRTIRLQPQVAAASDARGLAGIVEVYGSDLRPVTRASTTVRDRVVELTADLAAGSYLIAVRNADGSQSLDYTLTFAASTAAVTPISAPPPVWVRDAAPRPNELRVPATTTPSVTFARALDPATVTSSTVRLLNAETGAALAAVVTYDATARRVTVDPSAALVPGQPYLLRISGVGDAAGVAMPAVLRIPFVVAGPAGSRLTPLPPERVLDTRSGLGVPAGQLGAGDTRDLVLRGRFGIPLDATAVVLNLTGVRPSAGTYLQVYPTPASGTGFPGASNVNLAAGEIVPNLATVAIGAGGKVRVRNASGNIDVLVDLVGFYSPYGVNAFTALDPFRLVDTRDGTGVPAGRILAGDWVDVAVSGRGGVPADADAVLINLTGVNPATDGFVSAFATPAAGASFPETSNLNLVTGEVRPNLALVKLGASGRMRLRSSTAIDLLADVAGYFSSASLQGFGVAAVPARVLDTRSGVGVPAGTMAAGTYVDVRVTGVAGVPTGASAVVLNVTGIVPSSATVIRVFPTPASGTALPNVSNLNLLTGEVRANLVTVKVGANGFVRLHTSAAAVNLAADVAGWYAS